MRLTDERLRHTLLHPEMAAMDDAERRIALTLSDPEVVVRSRSDPEVELHHKRFASTPVSSKHLCVVVKRPPGGSAAGPGRGSDPAAAFVITAYLTDAIKKGEVLWKAP